jgi:hypothetical protein
MKILNFLFELIVVGLMGIPIIYEAEAVDYQQSVLIPSQIINGTTAVGLGAFALATGFALQTDITCAGACTVNTTLGVSVDGISYQLIPEFTKTYTTSQTVVFNVYSQFYKFYQLTISETSTNPATIAVTQSTKGQL